MHPWQAFRRRQSQIFSWASLMSLAVIRSLSLGMGVPFLFHTMAVPVYPLGGLEGQWGKIIRTFYMVISIVKYFLQDRSFKTIQQIFLK